MWLLYSDTNLKWSCGPCSLKHKIQCLPVREWYVLSRIRRECFLTEPHSSYFFPRTTMCSSFTRFPAFWLVAPASLINFTLACCQNPHKFLFNRKEDSLNCVKAKSPNNHGCPAHDATDNNSDRQVELEVWRATKHDSLTTSFITRRRGVRSSFSRPRSRYSSKIEEYIHTSSYILGVDTINRVVPI